VISETFGRIPRKFVFDPIYAKACGANFSLKSVCSIWLVLHTNVRSEVVSFIENGVLENTVN
jgi:hypothetical protein